MSFSLAIRTVYVIRWWTSSLLILSTGCRAALMPRQNNGVRRCFASREELCSELGEVENRHDGDFQEAASRVNTPIRFHRRTLWPRCLLGVWFVFICTASFAQQPESSPAEKQDSAVESDTPAEEPAASPRESKEQPDESVTAVSIDAALEQLDKNKDVDEETRSRLQELYSDATSELAKAEKSAEDAARYESWIASAAQDIEEAQRQKASPPELDAETAGESQSLNELVKNLAGAEQQLSDAREALATAEAEPQRRLDRKAQISPALVSMRETLAEVEAQLEGVETDTGSPETLAARKALLQSRRKATLAAIESLENERDAYAAQGELPRLQIDLATAQVKLLEETVRQLTKVITERRAGDAAAQKEDAERAWESAPPLLRPYAQVSIELAKRRLQLAHDIQDAAESREQISKNLKARQEDLARTKKRADAVQSDTVGVMLAKERSKLPLVSELERTLRSQRRRLREYQQELFDLEDRRVDLADLNEVVQQDLDELRAKKESIPPDAQEVLTEVFTQEAQILDGLLKDANRNFSLRIESLEDQEKLIAAVEDFGQFINTRVFWVRSANSPQWSDLPSSISAFGWLADPRVWSDAGKSFVGRLGRHPLLLVLFAAAFALLLLRPYLVRRLNELGQFAGTVACRTLKPTIWALFLTALYAAPLPLVFRGIGLGLVDATGEQVQAVSEVFSRISIGLFLITFFIQLCRPQGVCEAHFGWSQHSVSVGRATLRYFVIAGMPLIILHGIFEHQTNAEYQGSLGRACLVAMLILISWLLYRVLRPQDGVLAEQFAEQPQGRAAGWHRFWYPGIVFVPVVLAVLAIMGFHYTSWRLTVDLYRSFELAFLLSILSAVLSRAILLKRRRLRWQQLIESRQRAAKEQEEADTDHSVLEALDVPEEEVDLVVMGQQSRRLINGLLLLIGLLGLATIWSSEFPALTPLIERQLWQVEDVDGGTRPITVGVLIVAFLTAGVTIVASRNIPGLVDVVLLGRLGILSSTRYAISTLSQYTIAIVGVIVTCHMLGVTWDKAQWLVAALSVGLGFGLQEVVANFVCGILLLFERPIRVGDIVTLGETTGAVVRIHSRATTVRNWDRQEVVIPNKELITGRIINWTLADAVNRVVIQVGIAYGSDTNAVRELLQQIAAENDNVLDDPRPLITFEEFGDSTLNFVFRAYLANMDARLETIHELHTAINERFAAEGIEIAFPQRDLHLRSIDASLKLDERALERTP